MPIKQYEFGKYKLNIEPKVRFTGNACFGKNHCGKDDFELKFPRNLEPSYK